MDKEKLLQEQAIELLVEGLILTKLEQDTLEEKSSKIKDFISDHKDIGTEANEIKDEKHKESQELWNDYTSTLRDATYNMRITGKEFHYLRNYVVTKKVYDESNLFIGLKLKEDYFDTIDLNTIPQNNEVLDELKIQINSITLIHHLIKDMTVSNLNDPKTTMYANILTEIGNISKIFNMFNAESEVLSKDIYTWTIGLEPAEKQKVIDELKESQDALNAKNVTEVEEVTEAEIVDTTK